MNQLWKTGWFPVLLTFLGTAAYPQSLFESSQQGYHENEVVSNHLTLGGFIRAAGYVANLPENSEYYIQSAYGQAALLMEGEMGQWAHAKADIRFTANLLRAVQNHQDLDPIVFCNTVKNIQQWIFDGLVYGMRQEILAELENGDIIEAFERVKILSFMSCRFDIHFNTSFRQSEGKGLFGLRSEQRKFFLESLGNNPCRSAGLRNEIRVYDQIEFIRRGVFFTEGFFKIGPLFLVDVLQQFSSFIFFDIQNIAHVSTHVGAIIYGDPAVTVDIQAKFGVLTLREKLHTPNAATQRFNRG